MIIEINEEQRLILRDLLEEEIRYLKDDAIPAEEMNNEEISKKDVQCLKKELEQVSNLMKQLWYNREW